MNEPGGGSSGRPWFGLAKRWRTYRAGAYYRRGLALRAEGRLDEAAKRYRRALELDPGHAEAHNNLGAVLQTQGSLAAALESYRRAVDLEPDFSQPYLNLGRLQEAMGNPAGAAAAYRHALDRGLECDTFGHLLSAVEGRTTERAPPGYVRSVFDDFAGEFDRRLVNELGYRVPEHIGSRLAVLAGVGSRLRILDIGCGTGLCGVHVAGLAAHLTGIDVSAGMLEKARKRGIYHELVESDIADYLHHAPPGHQDAVIAADVLIYFGALDVLFGGVSRCLRSGGWFACSIERLAAETQDYMLLPSGRYAQSTAYVRRVAQAAGLREREASETTIRGDRSGGVAGVVFVFEKA